MKRIKLGTMILGAALCVVLSACNSAEKTPPASEDMTSPPDLTAVASPVSRPSEAPGSLDSVTFTDSLNRQVTLPRQPQRTAVLIGSFAHIWSLAGGDMVATANDAWTQFESELDLQHVVDLGTTRSISLELLLSTDPDFIIASSNTEIDVELMPVFEETGIPAGYFDVNTFDEYLFMLDICTQITGHRELYEQNGLTVKERVDTVIQAAANEERRPEVLYLRASASSVKAKGGDGTVLGSMLTDLGCRNIADTDDSLLEDLSIERIIADDPEYIFIVLQGNDEQSVRANLEKELTGNPAWNGLTAVQENRLFFMDQKLYNLKPNNRWGEAYEGVYDILYG